MEIITILCIALPTPSGGLGWRLKACGFPGGKHLEEAYYLLLVWTLSNFPTLCTTYINLADQLCLLLLTVGWVMGCGPRP